MQGLFLQPFAFRLVPDGIHFFERHVCQVLSLFYRMFLQIIEAADEFLVGTFQGIVGIDFIEACRIDEAEHDVTEFGFCFLLVHVGYLCLEFSEFFFHLIPYLFPFFPVEAYIAGLVLNAVSLDE